MYSGRTGNSLYILKSLKSLFLDSHRTYELLQLNFDAHRHTNTGQYAHIHTHTHKWYTVRCGTARYDTSLVFSNFFHFFAVHRLATMLFATKCKPDKCHITFDWEAISAKYMICLMNKIRDTFNNLMNQLQLDKKFPIKFLKYFLSRIKDLNDINCMNTVVVRTRQHQ